MKKLYIIFTAIIVLFGVLFAIDFYLGQKVQGYINESKVLSTGGKYQEALLSLSKAKNSIPSGRQLSKINDELIRIESLVHSQEYFNKGKSHYDNGEYNEAIGYFRYVSHSDINYASSQSFIKLAESKLSDKSYRTNSRSLNTVKTINPQKTSLLQDQLIDCKFRSGTLKLKSNECAQMVDCQLYSDKWIPATKQKCQEIQTEFAIALAKYTQSRSAEYLQSLIDSYSKSITYTNPINAYQDKEPEKITILGQSDSYTKIGNTLYDSEGDSYTKIGNTTYGNNGSNYTQIGNTLYDNDGESYQNIGNTIYGSNGTTYSQIGNTTYGNDGSSATQIGNTIYTNP